MTAVSSEQEKGSFVPDLVSFFGLMQMAVDIRQFRIDSTSLLRSQEQAENEIDFDEIAAKVGTLEYVRLSYVIVLFADFST